MNFRWPTQDDLKKLNLAAPLKLKEVRTNGVNKNALTAIQLVFENNIESPLFDGKNVRATGLTTVVIKNKLIKRTSSRVGHGYPYSLQFEFEASSQTIFD